MSSKDDFPVGSQQPCFVGHPVYSFICVDEIN